MGGIRLGTAVLALAIVGLPFAATATEQPLGIHKHGPSLARAP
jgi:hypothetical protein